MHTHVIEIETAGLIGGTGVTFTPHIDPDTHIMSWTNDGDLPNPDPVETKGIPGQKGDPGDPGPVPDFSAQVITVPGTDPAEVIVTKTEEPLNVNLLFKLPMVGSSEITILDNKITEEIAARTAAIGNLEEKLDPTGHQHPSSQINLLTGYTVSTSPSDLTASDSLNAALGKIQGYINEIRKACDDAD